ILVGDKVFLVSDPAELICVNRGDGQILWRRSNALEEVFGPEQTKQIEADYTRLREDKRKLQREQGKAKGDEDKQNEIKRQLEGSDRDFAELKKRFPPPPSFADGETTNSAAT